MTIADVLDGAAQYLEKYGWRQGSFGLDTGPRCMAGAMRSVCFHQVQPRPEVYDLYEAAETWLARFLGVDLSSLYSYNDAKDRDANDIICSLGHAAQQWRLDHE